MNRGKKSSAHFSVMVKCAKVFGVAKWLFTLVLILSTSEFSKANENEDLAGCIGHVNAVISSECTFILDASYFYRGNECDPGNIEIEVKLPSGKKLSGTSVVLKKELIGILLEVNLLPNPSCNFDGCWGTIKVEDKLPPLFPEMCSREVPCIDYDCTDWDPIKRELDFGTDTPFPDIIKASVYAQECSKIELFEYQILYKKALVCTDPDSVVYHFTAKDFYKNTSEQFYYFTLQKLIIKDITFPGTFNGDCVDDFLPETTGLPKINGKTVSIFNEPATTPLCNLYITYTDKTISTCNIGCDNSRVLLREWAVLDWCTQDYFTEEQLIELSDTMRPVILNVDVPESVAADPWTCEVRTYELPIPELKDSCTTGDIKYYVVGPEGVIIKELSSGHYSAWEMQLGVNEFTYIAEDCCGNLSDPYTIFLYVRDETKPNAIALEYSVISLVPSDPNNFDETAIGKFFAKDLDNASWDACGITEYYVRRADGDPNDCDTKDYYPYDWKDNYNNLDSAIMYSYDPVECKTLQDLGMMRLIEGRENESGTGQRICNDYGIIQYNGDEWGDFVAFCCEDTYSNFDDRDVDGDGAKNEHKVELIIFDGAGNWNITWGWVKVEDPTPPQFTYIKPLNLFCHDTFNFTDNEREIQKLASNKDSVRAEIGCNDNLNFSNVEGPYFMKGGVTSVNPNPDKWEDPHPSLFGNQIDFEYAPGFKWQAYNKSCSYGYGWMRYTVRNIKGTFAYGYQLIRVYYKDNFSCASVHWPENDHIVTDCENIPAEENLIWDSGPCELIGWTFSSDTFNFETNSCKKIINKYTVVDWCINDWYKDPKGPTTKQLDELWLHSEISENGATGYCNRDKDHNGDYINEEYSNVPALDGVYTFEQVIKIVDTIPPILANPNDWYYPILSNECETVINISNSAFDPSDCTPVAYNWELFLDYDHDGEFDETYRRHSMDVFFTLPNPLSGPMDSITARWKVWDGCGNTDIADFKIYSVDKKAPTPYCIDISSALMEDPDGDGPQISSVEIWAADFDRSSVDNCYGKNIYFTFDNIPFIVDYKEYEHYYTESGLLFTYYLKNSGTVILDAEGNTIKSTSSFYANIINLYNDGLPYEGERIYRWLPPGISPNKSGKYTAGTVYNSSYTDGLAVKDNDIIMTVWDEKLNSEYCLVTLTLRCQDCTDGEVAIIAGTISTETSIMVEDVTVELSGLTNPDYKREVISVDGGYAFGNTPMYLAYDIVASRDGDDERGVNTLDLLLIQRHILGLTPFDSPYKIIASDANNDRSVTGSDIIILRKLVLGYYTELPQNTSWKFVDAAQPLNLEEVLIDYNEVINIASLESNRMAENYIAVKIGDVNHDVFNYREGGIVNTRNYKALQLSISDRFVKSGESIAITFSGKQDNLVYGMQCEFGLDGLDFSGVGLNSHGISSDNFGDFGDKLRLSYHHVNGINANGNLFVLNFTAKKNGYISDMITLNTSGLTAEVYFDGGVEIGTIEMQMVQKTSINKLYQNEPNPFDEFTAIGFELEKSGEATLVIHNVAGKRIKTINQHFNKGYNKIIINKNELSIRGVLYYTIISGGFTGTKKMIIIE